MQGSIKFGGIALSSRESPRRVAARLAGRRIVATGVAAAALVLAWAPAALAVDFTVTETGDASDASLADGPNACDVDLGTLGDQCTLRAAVEESNTTGGADAILFNIPGGGVHTVAPATAFDDLTSPVTIDGFTQPGAAVNTKPVGKPMDSVLRIQLDGTGVSAANGFKVASGAQGSTIRGLVINRFVPYEGIEVLVDNVTIEGNYLGTNPAGDAARGNGDGVFGFGGFGTGIGGSLPEDRNLISGNVRDGVSTNTPIKAKGNYVGVASDGKSALGNGDDGLSLYSSFAQTVGGPGDEANLIAFNAGNAVEMVNPSVGTPITNNRIYENGGLGIDLNQDGVTPNDDDDPDGDANESQNYPELTSAHAGANATKVKGTLNSVPEQEFNLELFSNKAKDREGRKPIGTKLVATDVDGDASFSFKPSKKVKVGKFITATATNANDSTSEFSAPRKVKSG